MTSKHSFRVVSPTIRTGPLAASWVELEERTQFQTPLIVSVSRPSGNAVQRNRFRRIVRGYFLSLASQNEGLLSELGSESPRKALWIRVNRQYRFKKSIALCDWRKHLVRIQQKLSSTGNVLP